MICGKSEHGDGDERGCWKVESRGVSYCIFFAVSSVDNVEYILSSSSSLSENVWTIAVSCLVVNAPLRKAGRCAALACLPTYSSNQDSEN